MIWYSVCRNVLIFCDSYENLFHIWDPGCQILKLAFCVFPQRELRLTAFQINTVTESFPNTPLSPQVIAQWNFTFFKRFSGITDENYPHVLASVATTDARPRRSCTSRCPHCPRLAAYVNTEYVGFCALCRSRCSCRGWLIGRGRQVPASEADDLHFLWSSRPPAVAVTHHFISSILVPGAIINFFLHTDPLKDVTLYRVSIDPRKEYGELIGNNYQKNLVDENYYRYLNLGQYWELVSQLWNWNCPSMLQQSKSIRSIFVGLNRQLKPDQANIGFITYIDNLMCSLCLGFVLTTKVQYAKCGECFKQRKGLIRVFLYFFYLHRHIRTKS